MFIKHQSPTYKSRNAQRAVFHMIGVGNLSITNITSIFLFLTTNMPDQQEFKGNSPFHFVHKRESEDQTNSFTLLVFSTTGDLLVSGSKDCSVMIWVGLTGVMMHHILLLSTVISLAWGPQGWLSIGCLDITLVVAKNVQVSHEYGRFLATNPTFTAGADELQFGPDRHQVCNYGHCSWF